MGSYKILEWRNPVRRPLHYRFVISKEFSDIFKVAESKFSDDFNNEIEGTVEPRGLCQLKLSFTPIVETTYRGTALLETDEGSYSIELVGRSETPRLLINKQKISMDHVKINSSKSDAILISNKCNIPMKLKLNFTNDAFSCDKSVVTLMPEEPLNLTINFTPKSKSREKGEVQFTYQSEIDGEEKVVASIKLYGNENLPKPSKSDRHSSKETSSEHKSSHRSHSSRRKSVFNFKGEIINTVTDSESEYDETDNRSHSHYSSSSQSSSHSRSSSSSSSTTEKKSRKSRKSYSSESSSYRSDSSRNKSTSYSSDNKYESDSYSKSTTYDESKKSSRSQHSRHSHHSQHSRHSHHSQHSQHSDESEKEIDDKDRDESKKMKSKKEKQKEDKKYKFDGTEEKIVFYNRKYEKINNNNIKKGYSMTSEQIDAFMKNHTQKSLEELQNVMNNIYILNDNDGSNIPFEEILEKYRKGEITKNTLIGNDGDIYKSKSKLYIDKKGRILDVSNVKNMEIKFPHIKKHHTVKKKIEYENIGNHTVEMQAVDENGNPIKQDQELLSKKKNVKYKISPSSSKIKPNSSESFTISVEGLEVGNDNFNISIETKTKNPKRINILSKVSVIPDISEERMNALKNYSKADQTIESKLKLPSPHNDELIKDDIWKVLYPIIRVKMEKPSEEYHYIPYLEPIIPDVDILQIVQRPLAIPKEIQKVRQTWYANKVFMSFNHKENDSTPLTEKMVREENAEKFVKQIEKKAVVLKKR